MIKRVLIRIKQPIGEYFFCKMTAREIESISHIKRLKEGEGVQRPLDPKKVMEISKYCEDPDAIFPTSIILAVKQPDVSNNVYLKHLSDDTWEFCCNENEKVAEIIDGQHRIIGILKASREDMEMPVVLIFNVTNEAKAYIFATINSNQTKVNKSIIFELFSLHSNRSPLKTCHEIARAFNSAENSPFYRRLAMFGVKENSMESLTQGTFVQEVLTLITRDEFTAKIDALNIKAGKKLTDSKYRPMRHYFIQGQDNFIYRILFNYFHAVSSVFMDEWNTPDRYILAKTTGFGALISVLRKIIAIGIKEKDLSYEFFLKLFQDVKKDFDNRKIELTSLRYGSGKLAQKQLRDEFLRPLESALKRVNIELKPINKLIKRG